MGKLPWGFKYLVIYFETLILLGLAAAMKSKYYDRCNPINVLEIIKEMGYIGEEHKVQTKDGYILTLHRINKPGATVDYCSVDSCPAVGGSLPCSCPFPKEFVWNKIQKKEPVLLQHGLLSSSLCWVLSSPKNSLGFMLADEGYDVWLGNSRGNEYSTEHITLDNSEQAFWNFSWADMAEHDVPASFDYILRETGRDKLIYIGFSQGTTIFFAALHDHPEYNSKVSRMIAIAPVVFVSRIKTPFRHLTRLFLLIGKWNRYKGRGEYMGEGVDLTTCRKKMGKLKKKLYMATVSVLCGFNIDNFNKDLYPMLEATAAVSGTSWKNVMHFLQLYRRKKFQKFNFRKSKNLKIYKSTRPPQYDLSRVDAPVLIIYGLNDYLSSKHGVKKLRKNLKNSEEIVVEDSSFTHIDFFWGKNCKEMVYDPILEYLRH